MDGFLTIVALLSDACLLGAALGCCYLLVAAAMVLRFRRSETVTAPADAQPVTILKPLHGAEPGLSQRLARFCNQDYPAQLQVICGVGNREDRAAEIVSRCRARGNAIDLVVDRRRHGANPKISNLMNMLSRARHDILILSDSDIDVGRDYVCQTTAALAEPGVGAVTCLYYGTGTGNLWSQLSALAINSHFLPNAVLALTLGLAQPCFGATIALRRAMLRRIGDFDAFKDTLADDNEIGRAVRATGHRVVIPGFTVGHVCAETGLAALMMQDLRIARTIRSVDPAGYGGLVITHPFALALLAIPFASGSAVMLAAAILAGLALGCRAVLCLAVRHAFKAEAKGLWLIPLRDLLSFAVFVWGLVGNSVQWRGAAYHVAGNGRLTHDRGRA
jgi:ceramide glucosyltransferase